ncbi:MAG TPA: AI-2E family transporter [Candidatus Paceibacterota bacterium]
MSSKGSSPLKNEFGEQKVILNVSMGTLFKIACFALGAYLLYELRGLALVILSAVVIASVIEPGIRFLVRRGIQRVFSATIMYLAIFSFIGVMVSFVLPPLFSETISAINGLPKYVKTIDVLNPLNAETLRSVRTFFPDLPSTISVGDLGGMMTNAVSNFSGGLFDTVAGFFGGIVSLILVVVISFYLSVRNDGVGEFLAVITPLKHEKYVRGLWLRSQHKIGKWMQGQLVLALGVGIITYCALLVAGIPHPLLLAFVAMIFELIPIIGATLAAIPAFFLATLSGGFGLGLIVIAIYVVIQQIEAHILYPLVVKKVIGIPPLLVIIALVAGAQLAGLVGVLLAVPLSVALMEFINDVEKRKRFVVEGEEAK